MQVGKASVFSRFFENERMECREQLERLAGREFRLFPCKAHGKEPLVRWTKSATSNIHQVNIWLRTFADCNWAIACGKGSRLFVLDVDGYEGLESFAQLCGLAGANWKEIADNTLGVKTGKGSHLYFAYPKGTIIRNNHAKLGPGLDIRGDGGYVICPPSVHESGEVYHWLGDDESKPVSLAPVRLIEKITSKGTGRLRITKQAHRLVHDSPDRPLQRHASARAGAR
jgi:hypothetical protein